MRLIISAVLAIGAAPVAAVMHFVGQTSGGGQDALPSFATLIVQLGLSGVFLWQWQSERKERAAAQHQLNEFLEKFAPTLSDAVTVLQEVKTGLMQTVERVQAVPNRNDYDLALRRLELLTAEMDALIRDKKNSG